LTRSRSKYVNLDAGVSAARAKATTTATRRLVAILAADVVGYSRLMGADEEGTHERFKAHLVELLDPKIPSFPFPWGNRNGRWSAGQRSAIKREATG
jgi:class 3 adenylate cyclase